MSDILIIEDDPTLLKGLQAAFTFNDLNMIPAETGLKGLELLHSEKPDLIILDIMLPDIDGYGICRKIREYSSDIPIIFLSAKNQESDKLLGFELGAHDYITKPFSVKELLARIRVHLKRNQSEPTERMPIGEDMNRISIGPSQIDMKTFSVIHENGRFTLTAKEQKLLSFFIEKKNQVVSRDLIIDRIWGDDYDPSPKSLDNLIHRLRKKIEKDPLNPIHIINVHGIGYMLSLH